MKIKIELNKGEEKLINNINKTLCSMMQYIISAIPTIEIKTEEETKTKKAKRKKGKR